MKVLPFSTLLVKLNWKSKINSLYFDINNCLDFLISRLQKENIIDYVPHNLADYIARSTQCLWKRALLEKHFIVKNVRQEAKDSSKTVTATREATMKSVHQTAKSVDAVEGTISKTSTTQETVTSSATSQDTAKMCPSSSSSTSSSTSTRSLSATEVSQEEQSQQSKKLSNVSSNQLTMSNEGVTGMSSRDSIEATNRVAAKIFFSNSGMVKDTISLQILLSPASSSLPGAQHEVLTVHFAWTSEDRVAHTSSADVSRIHNLHRHL